MERINFNLPIKRIELLSLVIILFFLIYSCIDRKAISSSEKSPAKSFTSTAEKPFTTTPYHFEIEKFPDYTNIPEDNPTTIEGVTLGRYLFYDGRLSGNTDTTMLMSCSSCHLQKHSFECGIDNPSPRFKEGHPIGLTGIPTPHSMMPLINLAWNTSGYMWNGMLNDLNMNLGSVRYNIPVKEPYNFKNIESFVWMAIVAPHEMNGRVEKTVDLLQKTPMYPTLFAKAFGSDTVTFERMSKAIAQFVRTLVSANSKFDQYQDGKKQLTAAELNGLSLFTSEKADCFHCHGMPAIPVWTTDRFMNNAMDTAFNDPFDRRYVTKDPQDCGKYRVPTLRNIALTAPYMHDGRFKTLREVLEFYNSGLKQSPYSDPLMKYANRGGTHLSNKELDDLEAFLNTLTDSSFINNPAFSNPRPRDRFFIN